MQYEEQTEVNQPEESSTSESISNEPVDQNLEDTGTQDLTPENRTIINSPDHQPVDQDVDEMGVPWKNRYMESQKKLDKLSDQLNTVSEKIGSIEGQKTKEYSVEELENFMESTDNPTHRTWAKGEIRRIQRDEGAQLVRQELTNWQKQQQSEQLKVQTYNQVVQRYPDAFVKNAQGQIVGWNNQSQLAQRIGQYMQDPEVANNPRGLSVAAALAYSDLTQGQSMKSKQQQTQMKAEVKNLQKKTLTEGAGVSSSPQSKTPLSAAKEKFYSSGKVKDGAAAFKEILKNRGRIVED